jgi:hypothetical protein
MHYRCKILPALCHQHIDNTLEATKVVGTGALDKAQGVAEEVFSWKTLLASLQNLASRSLVELYQQT